MKTQLAGGLAAADGWNLNVLSEGHRYRADIVTSCFVSQWPELNQQNLFQDLFTQSESRDDSLNGNTTASKHDFSFSFLFLSRALTPSGSLNSCCAVQAPVQYHSAKKLHSLNQIWRERTPLGSHFCSGVEHYGFWFASLCYVKWHKLSEKQGHDP